MNKSHKTQSIAIVAAVVMMLGQKVGVLPFSVAFPGFALAVLIVVLLGLFGLLVLLWGLVKGNGESRGAASRRA